MRLPPLSRYSRAASSIAVATTASWFASINTPAASSCDKDLVAHTTTSNSKETSAPASSRLVFLGTGSSTGCPRPLCTMMFQATGLTDEQHDIDKRRLAPYCQVSQLAMTRRDSSNNPRHNKNYRNNPSLLIATVDQNNRSKNILIDAGKMFREGALRWFPVHNVASVDAIVLTHHHMDAAAGLDDVRGFQKWQGIGSATGSALQCIPMPLFLSKDCLADLQDRFPWLLPRRDRHQESPTLPTVARHVASFDVQVFEPFRPFIVEGLEIVPLPVMHGEDLVSFGFAFTLENLRVVYLSDISRMLPETLERIRQLGPTDVLVIDALHPTQTNAVHFSLDQAMDVVRSIGPKQTYLVGMNCDSFLPHEEMNQHLRAKYGNVQLAYDGQVIQARQNV